MESEGVPLPVKRAASDTARPPPLQVIRSGAANGVAIQLPERGSPWILVFEVAPDVLSALPEVVPGTRFEDDHADATPSKLPR